MTPADQPPSSAKAKSDVLLPRVRLPRAWVPVWLVTLALAVMGVVLFIMLETRRATVIAPAVQAGRDDFAAAPQIIPPLIVPPAPPQASETVSKGGAATTRQNTMMAAQSPVSQQSREQVFAPQHVRHMRPQHFAVPLILPTPPVGQQLQPQPELAHAARLSTDPALVYDAGGNEQAAPSPSGDTDHPTTDSNGSTGSTVAPGPSRVTAGLFHHRATTIPQGALISAVLETALDSTRPGLARALVTRDVYGFDGTRLLIPRGSRLVGEYKGDLAPGQSRTLILWTRLTRPDGATIALGSPTSDPLGKIGVKGKVNTHFLSRLGTAILQTSLNVGVALAGRSSGSSVVLALPGAVQGANSPLNSPAEIKPTLNVRQGTSIAVFVARDLDFTRVEGRR